MIMGFRVLPDFPIVEAKAALPRFGHTQSVLPAQWVWEVRRWLRVRASPVIGECVFLPISAAAPAELVPLALVVVVRVPNVQVKQAPERLHFRSMVHRPA